MLPASIHGRTELILLAAGQNAENVDAGWQPQVPLAVTLDSFTAERTPAGVLVRWRTLRELNTLGFRVLRSDTGRLADAAPVNQELILASGAGTEYSLFDSNGSTRSVYWLEETEVDGTVRLYGPVTARPAGPLNHRQYLPIAMAD